jgi:hypothetical protein
MKSNSFHLEGKRMKKFFHDDIGAKDPEPFQTAAQNLSSLHYFVAIVYQMLLNSAVM